MDIFLDILLDSIKDVVKMVPVMFLILFFTDLLMLKLKVIKAQNSPVGVVGGALFGLIPQCGVPVGFSQLYAKGTIGLGVLFAVFLASSDEALIIAAANYEFSFVVKLVATKILIAVAVGLILYFAGARLSKANPGGVASIDLAQDIQEDMGKEQPPTVLELLWKTAKSTLLITLYVFVAVLALGLVFHFVGEDAIAAFMSGRSRLLQPVLAALVGFIPSCASSVLVTEAYIGGFISFGALISGLCANTGYGILVIFRACPPKQAFRVLGMLLGISILAGELLFFL